jgi:iron complex outermembrane recepter protein
MFPHSLRTLARGFLSIAPLLACAAHANDVAPPEVLTRVDATPPPSAPRPLQNHVLLEFTVGADGIPSDIVALESAGTQWDEAVIEALAKWRFKPAMHGGVAVASRTRLEFKMPDALNSEPDSGSDESIEAVLDGGHPRHQQQTTVLGRGVSRSRGASDFVIEVGALQFVPRKSAAEFLKLAPGILLTNEGGEGHPDRIFLRGFDAREGQDLELTVDGVPINDSGNLHGNGYADLGFIIPELVENLRVLEGPLDPRQGNYAVAGSADYQLGLAERGLLLKGSYGSFDTARVVGLWGPPGETSRTFGAFQLFRTSGFG